MKVIFDLGKVLIEWDPRHLYRQVFAREDEMEWFLAHVCDGAWNLEQDRGRTFDAGVAEAQGRHPKYAREIALYRDRWTEMIPGAIDGSVEILEALHTRGTALYALTNWNGDTFRMTRPRFAFLERFRDIIVSGDERLLKPDPAIFKLLLKRNGLEAAECLFVDDSPKNVKGAEAVRMRAHHFTSPESLRAELRGLGLL